MGSKKDAQLFNDYIKNKRSYADGGTIDEDPPQNTSERPITNFDPKGDPYNPTYGYNPGAGYVRSVFDLYDAPVIGDALSIYDNDYFSLPEAEIVQLQDAKAMLDLQEEAARRYKQYGIKPTQKDFRIKVDNAVTPSQEITNHEINHFNQYIHQDNPSWNKSELDKITKQFKGKLRDKIRQTLRILAIL